MKKLIFLLLALIAQACLFGQTLHVLSDGGKLYLLHQVAARENWYSLGRTYNISPKDIAPFNNLTLQQGLSVGQSIRIPLTPANFFQAGSAGADEVFVPLYHTVSEKEGLYRIGQTFNKVSVENLQAWNNLPGTEISKGRDLVVGYLKVKREQSPALATRGVSRIGAPTTNAVSNPLPAQEHNLPPAPDPSTAKANPSANVPKSNPASNKTTPAVSKPAEEKTVVRTASSSDAGLDGTGYFKDLYSRQATGEQVRVQSGAAAIFKSTSGWQDGKYYALMNNVTPGTVVKVTNSGNGRSIYAKVLGELPPGKENEGLIIRISNSGGAELQVNEKDPRFTVEVNLVRNS